MAWADRAVDRLAVLGVASDLDGAGLLDVRSTFTGLGPQGRISAGGSCRVVATSDSWCAVNLPRLDDLDLLPAWLGVEPANDEVPWAEVSAAVSERPTEALVEAGQELGLAVAALGGEWSDAQLRFRGTESAARPWLVRRAGERTAVRRPDEVTVVDLSSLWAGPSCARLLGRAGARIVKVESSSRPDGSRAGDPGFHRWLHEGHELVEIDFAVDEGRRELVDIVHSADVVLEGSRPRAFERLGIDPVEVVSARPGTVWVSITGYGRCGPWRDRVAFGDDAAVAGGLVEFDPDGAPMFVADAVADPLTGVAAAALTVGALAAGGGMTVDVALREVARSASMGAAVVW